MTIKSRSLLIHLLEEKYNRPIRDIITDAYNEHGSLEAAAAFLEVNPRTFYGWLEKYRVELQIQRRAVPA